MARIVRRPFGFQGKLALIVLLALATGFLWAMADSGRSFADVARIIAPGEPTPVATAPPPSVGGAMPPKAPPGPGQPPVAPSAPVPAYLPTAYSKEKMDAVFEEIDGHLKRGRIKEARELLRRQNAALVPASHIEKFRRSEDDLGR